MNSKCHKCGMIGMFGLQEVSPINSKYKYIFIQCNGCGTPVGVVDYMHTNTSIEITNKKIEGLERKIDNLEHSLKNIINLLNK